MYSPDIEWATKARKVLIEVGVCPDCLSPPTHHLDEPFSTCECGTGEDYGKRAMQLLQREHLTPCKQGR